MTTVYLHDNQQTQTIHCSDGSQGVMQLAAPYYQFRFYSHQHPSFCLVQSQIHDGATITVKDIQSRDDFQLKLV
ncbi:hypothetical protein [Limosilactobacillus antri]|uniref:Uncharacterized protein n=1 Tax=Limosilactobacillus antri DSM 16041 TaxID=525309 RepID=A0ABR5P024_9LACO|nr:hypothetical protein [Limosilactobacillus antri]KRK59925.1 hypothetical protein FC31_GL000199 [Limosilactobacillus antri DSM 16041]